jgi:hypothetical protein
MKKNYIDYFVKSNNRHFENSCKKHKKEIEEKCKKCTDEKIPTNFKHIIGKFLKLK